MKKLLFLVLLLLTACSQVQTGEVGIKTTYGKVVGDGLSPGWYFYLPVVSSIHKLNTKIQTVEQDSQAASKDLQNVQTEITLNYHLGLIDPVSHYTRLGANQEQIEASIVKPAMSETFKSVVALYTAEELISKREAVSTLINTTLSVKLKQYDLFVDSISITSFKFSTSFASAIEAKVTAQQRVLTAQNDLLRIKVEAEQKIVEAQAQASAMSSQRQVVTPELIQLKMLENQALLINKWNGKLPEYVGNNNPMSVLNVK